MELVRIILSNDYEYSLGIYLKSGRRVRGVPSVVLVRCTAIPQIGAALKVVGPNACNKNKKKQYRPVDYCYFFKHLFGFFFFKFYKLRFQQQRLYAVPKETTPDGDRFSSGGAHLPSISYSITQGHLSCLSFAMRIKR